MRRLLACLTVAATTAALTAPAATSAQSDEPDHNFTIGDVAQTTATEPVPGSAVMSAVARANVRTATWKDTAGDGPIPARDLRRLSVTHNRSNGTFTASFRFGAQPKRSTRSIPQMYIGDVKNGACHARAAIASRSDRGKAQWVTFKADGTINRKGTGSYKRSGKTVTLRSKARPLRKSWTCAFAVVISSAEKVYDDTGYVRLHVPPRPKLRLYTPDTRRQTSGAVGQWKRVKVKVANDGDAKARRVRVHVSRPRGVQVKPRTVTFKPIKVGDDRTKVVRIKLKKRSTKTVKLRATAKNANSPRRALVIHPKPKPLARNLVGRYFWGYKSHPDFAWDNRAIAFVNKRFAYVGFPKRGVPNCKRVTKHCKRYTYHKKRGKLRVGGTKGSYRKGNLVYRGIKYAPTKLPRRGTRWNLELIHRGFNGCQVFQPCATWTESLKLRKNGTFKWHHSSIITVRANEVGMPPGKGRYRIKRNGHLVLRYSGGKTRHTTIAIDTDAKRRPDPYGAGLIINDINFYP